MHRNREKFIKQVSRSIEKLAKKHGINMWAQQIARHSELIENGSTDVTQFWVFSGAEPTERDVLSANQEQSDTSH